MGYLAPGDWNNLSFVSLSRFGDSYLLMFVETGAGKSENSVFSPPVILIVLGPEIKLLHNFGGFPPSTGDGYRHYSAS